MRTDDDWVDGAAKRAGNRLSSGYAGTKLSANPHAASNLNPTVGSLGWSLCFEAAYSRPVTLSIPS